MGMSLSKLIDIHVLTHSGTKPEWLDQCLKSLEGHPVVVHVVEGVEGSVGAGRAKGYALGDCEYVGFVDSDDYVLPGHYDLCLEALRTERAVVAYELEGSLMPSSKRGYHNGVVYRREDVEPLLSAMADAHYAVDSLTRSTLRPTQLEHTGYVWREHAGGAHNMIKFEEAKAEAAAWHASLNSGVTE